MVGRSGTGKTSIADQQLSRSWVAGFSRGPALHPPRLKRKLVTGKTSIAVGRMWACYSAFHVSQLGQASDAPPVYRQAFVTANTVLRAQVQSLFFLFFFITLKPRVE